MAEWSKAAVLKVGFRRVRKYSILLMNPLFLWGFSTLQNASENLVKSQGVFIDSR
jgi:hypothetical protein